MLAPGLLVLGQRLRVVPHVTAVRVQVPHGMQFLRLRVRLYGAQRYRQQLLLRDPCRVLHGHAHGRSLRLLLARHDLQAIHDGLVLLGLVFLIGGEPVVVIPCLPLHDYRVGNAAQQRQHRRHDQRRAQARNATGFVLQLCKCLMDSPGERGRRIAKGAVQIFFTHRLFPPLPVSP